MIVTGGASGLGLGAARHLASMGASIALLDVQAERGASAADEIGARFWECDVTDPAQVGSAIDAAAEAVGPVRLLVNAAGIAPAQRVLSREGEMFDLELFRLVIGINLVGAFDVARNTARVMASNPVDDEGSRGLIVNVASIAAFEGQVGQAAYSASKGGIVGLTLPLSRDLASIGVRVVTIAPGIMDTPMLAGAPQELKDSLAGLAVFPRRLGTPDDFAGLVAAVVNTPLLNGEVIRLDAGARMPPR